MDTQVCIRFGCLCRCGVNVHLETGSREHVHQGIDGEFIDFAAYYIADSRAGNAHEVGSLCLSQTLFGDMAFNGGHELGFDAKFLRFPGCEAQILENVAD